MNYIFDHRPKSIIKVDEPKLKAKTPISLLKSKKNSVDIVKSKLKQKSSHINKLKQSVVQEQAKYPSQKTKNKSTVVAKVEIIRKSVSEDIFSPGKIKHKVTITSHHMLTNNSKDNKTRVRTTEDDENDFVLSFNDNKMHDFSKTESSRLMLENNVIKRDTFIDGNFNRKLRNENKLEEYFTKNTGLVINLFENRNIIDNFVNQLDETFRELSIKDDFYINDEKTLNLTNTDKTLSNIMSNVSIFDEMTENEYQIKRE